MYNQFFGLQKNPFGMTPDPAFLFMTEQHREALAGLTYAVLDRKGFVVLTGEAGTGKTTLVTRVLMYLPGSRVQSSVILNPTLTPSEFLEMALLNFGISPVPASKAQRLVKFRQFLLEGQQSGKISTLIIDEAHKLSPEVLEEIRLLGNFEYVDQKLLQILLIGQSELGDLLNRENLRQLKQRVALRFAIEPLSVPEVEQYIKHRWSKAGGQSGAPFTAEALPAIVRHSKGIPRVINAICDNALILAFGEGSATVTAKHVAEACEDLDLRIETAAHLVNGNGAGLAAAAASAPQLAPITPLERYAGPPPKPSLLMRWVGKLGLGEVRAEEL